MKSYTATVIDMSDLVDRFNEYYGSSFSWIDFNQLMYGSKFAEGIRYFYYGTDIENDDDFSKKLCELLALEFPSMEIIYIDTEA